MAETAFQKGHNFASHILSSSVSNTAGHVYTERVAEVEDVLSDLLNKLNKKDKNGSPSSIGGFAAEVFHEGTFNANAKASGSTNYALAGTSESLGNLNRNVEGSVDVRVMSESGQTLRDYNFKYNKNAESTFNNQTALNRAGTDTKYHGDFLNPSDQNDKVIDIAKSKLDDPNLTGLKRKAIEQVAEKSSDRITDGEGHYSKPLSKKDDVELGKDIKEGKLTKKRLKNKYGAQNDSITPKTVMKEAIKAGATAAIISAVMQTAPEIIKAFDYLIKNKQIDLATIGKIGLKGLNAGVEGFMLGSITRILQIKIAEEVFGATISTLFSGSSGSLVLATTVSFIWTSIKNTIMYLQGKIDGRTLANNMVDYALISGGFLVASNFVRLVTFGLPLIGTLVGSFVGSAFAFTYNIVKKRFISFCADTGFTCFGLVDQDYTLPESVLSDMGIDLVPISRTDVSRTKLSTTQLQGGINRTNYETVDVKIVKRGVIGLNKIGFIV